MALNDLELSLMAFPQSWNATTQRLNVNLLLLPVGDPLQPLGTGPQFAGTTIYLNAQIVAGLDSLPSTTSPVALTVPYIATPPIAAVALFKRLVDKLPAGTTVTSGKLAQAPDPGARIMKALPASYTNAFPFEKPKSGDTIVGDGYGCAVRAQSPGLLNPKQQDPPPKIIAWGQILSYALRQPLLAQALGLVYQIPLPVPAATLQDGGFLYFALDASSNAHPYVNDWKANPDTVKYYAARIPALAAHKDRDNLFAAALFPIVAVPGSNLAEAQLEAEIYDDGFAQVVHCNQPTTVDAATADPDQIPPGTEAGIQIGWDDEQVTTWLNRQIDLLRDRVGGTTNAPEAPLGVQGYRVDVQLKGDTKWHSLCKVTGSLPFSGSTSDGSGSTPSGELSISPAPIRPVPADWIDLNPEPAWLPLYFAQWRGKSLVVHDDVMTAITPAKANKMVPSVLGADLAQVPTLRYGKDYLFRVRFVDLTGGGPTAGDDPVHPGLAPIGESPFRRYIPPKALEVAATPPAPPFPQSPDKVRTITKLEVRRPRICYPEAIFAGVDPNQFTGANLTNLINQAKAANRALSVPDPDVDRFQVFVEARIPAHDTGTEGVLPGELDGDHYRVVYSCIEHFPASGGSDPVVTLTLDYIDQDDIATMTAPPDDSSTIPVPTARDVRIRLIPLCIPKSNYYGTPEPPIGSATDYIVRKEAADESSLFPFDPPAQLKAFYFQPGNDLPQLLAQALELDATGLILSGKLGKRTVFAASGALRHSLSADAGSITFANQAELLDHWIVAFIIDLDRDWTWEGFTEPAVLVFRDSLTAPVGTISFPGVVSASALGGLQASADRSTTRILFFDALSPDPQPGQFPAPLNPKYTLEARFPSAPTLQRLYSSLILPITTRPAQTPKIASTGIAESPFQAAPDYSETSLRDRFLWIEFDQPLADPEDAYFARVLAYGPDPLLAAVLLPPTQLPTPIEPPLPIDPEPIRTIFAGQASDESGLDAMTELIKALPTGSQADGLHFLLPLPPGISPEALELFGFWTYEFRVGHRKLWSTAQGRYGRPLRVTGIQHPAPHLICTSQRNKDLIFVTAPYATTVYNGVRVYDLRFGDPQTTIWVMLYAQVMQADGASHRNVLLDHKEAQLLPDLITVGKGAVVPNSVGVEVSFGAQANAATEALVLGEHTVNREPRGFVIFDQGEIQLALSILNLPLNSPLSVLAVEVLPGPLHFRDFRLKDQSEFEVNLQEQAAANAGAADQSQEDPLGPQLGLRRILRTSPLTAVPAIC